MIDLKLILSRKIHRIITFYFLIQNLTATLVKADETAYSIPYNGISSLSVNDQKSIITAALDKRLEITNNFHYEATLDGKVAAFEGGKYGRELIKLYGGNLRHWKINNSFRIDTDRVSYEKPFIGYFVKSGYNGLEGVAKSTIHYSIDQKPSGRLDVIPDKLAEDNRYQYWTDGESNGVADNIIRYLRNWIKVGDIIADDASSKIIVSVPWQPIWSNTPIGIRKYTLDSTKGFLPIRGSASFEFTNPNHEKTWRTEDFNVYESVSVNGVWMPTLLEEVLRASYMDRNQATVWTTKVSKLESGKVVAADLEIPFDDGMVIVDAIKGITYTSDSSGNPKGKIERTVGATVLPKTAATPTPRFGFTYGFFAINIGVFLLFVAYALRRVAIRKSN